MNNIYLIGMMGTGKTVTGRSLSKLLRYGFVDLDQRIESKSGMIINDIFKRDGEAHFRKLESEALREAAAENARVVATGGGIVIKPENISVMRSSGKIFFLEASVEMILKRLEKATDRPLLATPDRRTKLTELLNERQPLYEAACSGRVMTDGKTAQAVAEEIVQQLKAGV